MTVRTVLVCEAQVPFVHGGAETHVRELVRELRARGYETELVSVPASGIRKKKSSTLCAWRLLDPRASRPPVDLVYRQVSTTSSAPEQGGGDSSSCRYSLRHVHSDFSHTVWTSSSDTDTPTGDAGECAHLHHAKTPPRG